MDGGSQDRTGIALGVDVGASKVAVGRVTADGTLLERARASWPAVDAEAEVLFATLRALIDDVARGDEVVCGIGSAGPMIERGESVSPVNLPGWRAFPLRARVAALTGLPTFLDGDAKALALAEGWTGTARGVRDYVAMVVSTGIGGGIVLDGRLLDGARGNAGHIGHLIVVPGGRRCGCGARGCLEAEASGTAIAAITGRPPMEAPPEVRARSGELVGIAVASVANLLDLRLAVVAGSMALGFGDAFFGPAQRALDAHARLDFSDGARIVRSTLGDDGPLVGAAAVGFAGRHGVPPSDKRGPP